MFKTQDAPGSVHQPALGARPITKAPIKAAAIKPPRTFTLTDAR